MHAAHRSASVTECNDQIVAVSSDYAALLGYQAPAALIGQPIGKVIGREDRERMIGYGHARAAEQPAPLFYEFKAARADGTEFPVLARVETRREGATLLITTSVEPAAVAALTPTTFSDIYDTHSSRIFALLLKITSCRSDAEDLLHDTFLQAWQQRERYDAARSSIFGWLVMIARSRALDRMRKSGRQIPLTPEALEGIVDVESDAMTRTDSNRAAAAMRNLAPAERAILQLSFFEGLSQREIATRLNTPLGTVKTRSLAAMKKLRAVIC